MDSELPTPFYDALELHKDMVYRFVTGFAQLDTFISHYIASYFKTDLHDKVDLTDLLLVDMNSQKQFDIFVRLLQRKDAGNENIEHIKRLYISTRKMRNTLSHSYMVPAENLNFNGNALKLTKIEFSKGRGYTTNVQKNEYIDKSNQLQDLLHTVYELVRENL